MSSAFRMGGMDTWRREGGRPAVSGGTEGAKKALWGLSLGSRGVREWGCVASPLSGEGRRPGLVLSSTGESPVAPSGFFPLIPPSLTNRGLNSRSDPASCPF